MKQRARHIKGVLRTSSVYMDKPTLRVLYQVKDDRNCTNVNLDLAAIYMNVSLHDQSILVACPTEIDEQSGMV